MQLKTAKLMIDIMIFNYKKKNEKRKNVLKQFVLKIHQFVTVTDTLNTVRLPKTVRNRFSITPYISLSP